MIFDPACKRVRRLFKPWRLFPIVHLSRVEWQVLVPVFMSLITWLDASTFIKVYGLHSLTKHVSASCGKTTNCDKYAVNNQLYQHPKGGCTHQERYLILHNVMYSTI